MPEIWSSSSIDETPPCWSRKSMICCAVTGPMPSIVSSCSSVAEPRLIGAVSVATELVDPALVPSPTPTGLLALSGTVTC
jgi:hypothetical protein